MLKIVGAHCRGMKADTVGYGKDTKYDSESTAGPRDGAKKYS